MDPDTIMGMLEFLIGGLGVMAFLISRVIKAVRSEDWTENKAPAGKKRPPKRSTSAGTAGAQPAFRSEAADHEHITVGGLSKERRLEQLDALLEAGLLDKEEYRERKERIEEESR